ncbi:MAG: pilus assembly protein TadG-related protein [Paracoccaceae bacterium]
MSRFRSSAKARKSRLIANAAKFRRSTVGGVAAVVAILSPVMIGGMGLGAETGYWYLTARKLQNAADVAAHGTALRANQGDQEAALQGMADYIVGESDVNMNQTSVTVNQPPLSGAYVEDGNAIEIVVTQTVPRMFSAIYEAAPLDLSARAVATALSGGQGCILALSPDVQGAITITGSSNINLIQCDFISNATGVAFDMSGHGGATIAGCVQTTGSATTTGGLIVTCPELRQNRAPVADPFAGVPEPASTGACQDSNVGQNNQTTSVTPVEPHASGMPSMRFCNGLNLSGTVNLDPGIYLIEGGDFRINANASVTGTGVVFYMADDVEIRFNGTAAVIATAPTTGTYAGILFFGSRDATSASHQISGTAGTAFNGAVYTPSAHLDYSGNNSTGFTNCTQIVANTIEFSGNGTMMMHCLFPPAQTIQVASSVSVVE